jgi:sugar lactone lactonase YvrE
VPVPANNPNGLDTGTLTLTPYYTATLTCPGTGGTTASKTLAGPNGLPVQQPTPINTPQGMAFAPNGNLYVANEDSGQVTVYAPGLPGSNGQLTALPGQTITLPTPTEVESPEPPNAAALAFDSAGDLFVVDNDNDQIDVFSPAGVLLTAYPLDRLSYEYPPEPTGIAVDGQGYVYVTAVTYPNAVLYVYKYSPQTTPMFTLVTTWTGDSNSNTWSWLYTAAIDGNYLLVGDSYYGEDTQVVAYALNDVRTPAAPGAAAILPVQTTFDSNGSYQVVSGIAIDASQNIYVSDPAFGRVDVFSSIVVTDSGVSGASPLGATGSIPAQDPMFSYSPTGVAVDGNVNVYAADGSNNTVDVFAPYASDCNAGVCSADFKYDFQPFVTLSFTTDDSDDITLSWSARGVLPSSASCTLSVYDGSDGPYPNPNALTTPPSGSYGQTGEATFSSSAGFGYAVIACPGATQSLNYGFTE